MFSRNGLKGFKRKLKILWLYPPPLKNSGGPDVFLNKDRIFIHEQYIDRIIRRQEWGGLSLGRENKVITVARTANIPDSNNL
jgi:hypothetical protein